MKKILIAAVAASGLATPAFAESTDTAVVTLGGNVQQICTVVPNASVAGSNTSGNNYTVSGDNVTFKWNFGINNTTDPTQATIGDTNQSFFSIAFKTFCNDDYSTQVSYTNGAMKNPQAAPAGFTNSLPYGIDIKQIGTGAASFSGENAPTAGGTQSWASDPFDGTTQIDFIVPASSTPPVAGDYSETVTVIFAADAAPA